MRSASFLSNLEVSRCCSIPACIVQTKHNEPLQTQYLFLVLQTSCEFSPAELDSCSRLSVLHLLPRVCVNMSLVVHPIVEVLFALESPPVPY